MNSFSCHQCGTDYDDTLACCPTCGASSAAEADVDPREEQLRALLEAARANAQAGDVAAALCCAREALAQRNDCSTTHALLGQLYEQQGDPDAARYHFQAALHVAATPPPEVEMELPLPPAVPARPPVAGVMMLVLIGCILLSGLAALFTFRAEPQHAEQDAVLQVPGRRQLPDNPRWTWKVPTPVATHAAPASQQTDAAPAPAHAHASSNEVVATAAGAGPGASDAARPSKILGPSARAHGTASVAGKPSLDAADQAFFRGEYDRAIALYEVIIQVEQSPRIFRDLAWCYQQLGNSPKAMEYLGLAIQGYRDLLTVDPNNSAAQQGLDSCQAALRTLTTSREHDAVP